MEASLLWAIRWPIGRRTALLVTREFHRRISRRNCHTRMLPERCRREAAVADWPSPSLVGLITIERPKMLLQASLIQTLQPGTAMQISCSHPRSAVPKRSNRAHQVVAKQQQQQQVTRTRQGLACPLDRARAVANTAKAARSARKREAKAVVEQVKPTSLQTTPLAGRSLSIMTLCAPLSRRKMPVRQRIRYRPGLQPS